MDNLPAFLRNQSVEGLESQAKHELDPPMCRHISVPDDCELQCDSDSSDDELTETDLNENFRIEKMDVDRSVLGNIVQKAENLMAKKASYDVTDVTLRNPECMKGERKIPEVDCRRFNIDYLTKSPIMAEGVKNIPKHTETQKPVEKSGWKLLSPKFSRLFKPNSAEVVRNKPENCENKEEKSRSKFFIHRPASPSNIGRSYKVRPVDETDRNTGKGRDSDVIKSDLKLASLGKPMTPIFRRHIPTEKPEFADGRFSYRDRRTKYDPKATQEPKFVDIGRNRIKAPVSTVDKKLAPLIRSSQINNIPALTTVLEKDKNENKSGKEGVKRREGGISRSNYVSLANLRITKARDLENTVQDKARSGESSPAERVI